MADPQPLLATDSEATNTKATNALRDSFANLEDVAIGGASGRKPTTDAIVLASAEESISESAEKPAEESGLKLGKSSAPAEAPLRYSDNPFKQAFEWRPPTDSMTTIGSGLAIVLGLLLCVAWIIKKSMPRSARVLPGEVAEVLGRVQLGRRQTAQLIKVGRKLVLVATSPDGVAETITEIDSEADVQHLLRICEESHGRGSSAAFDEIFRQMTGEPTSPGFLGDEAPAYDPRRLAAAYANTPGGQGRG